ncbi:MAG: D-3-phosphoglycerate dehydrogenase [Limisphaerales bacterium]|jgi:D-3-phosphoglycerate dehydrogenase
MRVLITDHIHPYLALRLTQMGFICDVRETITNEEVLECISEYEGIIIATKIKVYKSLIDLATNLKFVGRAGSGMENVDVAYAQSKGIACVNSPEGNRNAVAEHAIGMILSLMNHIPRSDREMRSGIWMREENRGEELMGRTIGLIGFGNTGETLAKRLRGFEMTVLAYDPYRDSLPDGIAILSDLKRIKEEADILSLHLPLTPETAHFFNLEFASSFRKPFYLINTSRGSVVNTAELIIAIRKGYVRAAALDVFENEKPPSFDENEQAWWDEIRQMDRILLTPHVAGWTQESKKRIAKVLSEKIKNLGIA